MVRAILLTSAETQPDLTHYALVNFMFEEDRSALGKNGLFNFWIAKVYVDGSDWEEYPVPGVNVKIEGGDFNQLMKEDIPKGIKVKDLPGFFLSWLQSKRELPAGTIIDSED